MIGYRPRLNSHCHNKSDRKTPCARGYPNEGYTSQRSDPGFWFEVNSPEDTSAHQGARTDPLVAFAAGVGLQSHCVAHDFLAGHSHHTPFPGHAALQ